MRSYTSVEADSPCITVNIPALLSFFDEKPCWSTGQATSIVGIAGEDLNSALFQHFLRAKGAKAEVLKRADSNRPLPVTIGRRKGPRLDRWIRVQCTDQSITVFQTEIKNWSAHAIGGETLSVRATTEEVQKYKEARWERRWGRDRSLLKEKMTAKVLTRMKAPDGVNHDQIRPLLIFWEAIGPRDSSGKHFFSVDVENWDRSFDFPELWIFSASSYLRSLNLANITLDMPETADRLRLLERLFSDTS